MDTTAKYGLRYPEHGDEPRGYLQIQQLAEDVEANVATLYGTLATRPDAAAVKTCQAFYATDTHDLFVSDGTNWHWVRGPGEIRATARATAPEGWLLCDGASLVRADYTPLFNAISTTYGAADGTHFNLPDLRGRVPVGVDGAAARLTANDALGNSSGEEKHVIANSELPAKMFMYQNNTGGSFSLAAFTLGSGSHYLVESFFNEAPLTVLGQGNGHNNMPPYQITNYVIKY